MSQFFFTASYPPRDGLSPLWINTPEGKAAYEFAMAQFLKVAKEIRDGRRLGVGP